MATSIVGCDTGWLETSPIITGITVKYRCVNKIVFISRGMANAQVTANTPTKIGVLPEGFRPSLQTSFVVQWSGENVMISVNSSGEIYVISSSGYVTPYNIPILIN